jgi:hypothetical protein
MDYFKTNFTIVNYVNDYHDADVHILVTYLPTGSGGESYHIRLLGQERFRYMNDTLIINIPENFTADETRSMLLDKIQLGLVPFLLKTPFSDKLFLTIDDSPVAPELHDPWKSWVFEISGTGSYYGEKFSKSYNCTGSFYVSKVTPQLKIESINYFGFNETKLRYLENDTLVYSFNLKQQDLTSQNVIVKSMGNHFGIGGFVSLGKSEYSNLDFQLDLGPAVEYNIFSYDEAATRQCRFLYRIMYEHSKYNMLTVYNKMYDDLFRHNLNIEFTYFESWGSFSASAYGTSYLNDLSQYSLGASAIASIRVYKGLSFNISAGAGYCTDQRSLRQEPVDPLGFVTGMREMEQGLSYSINLGIAFRFGSKYNNTVNARFGF